MRLLLLGGPGSGKGTQGVRLAQRRGLEHIAAGDALRGEVPRHRGRPARRELRRPRRARARRRRRRAPHAGRRPRPPRPGATCSTASRATSRRPTWPTRRSRATASGWTAVVYLEVAADELRRRLLARAEIEDRSDDTPDVIEHRLEVFAHDTFPLVEHYRERGLLITVAGDQAPDAVTADVLSRLG